MSSKAKNLSRRYGFFECSKCRRQWESSLVYLDKSTKDVPYGQECIKCNTTCKPYRIERIKCRECAGLYCMCKDKPARHIDVRKNHRRELCEKCQAGFPCHSTTTDDGGKDDDDENYNIASGISKLAAKCNVDPLDLLRVMVAFGKLKTR